MNVTQVLLEEDIFRVEGMARQNMSTMPNPELGRFWIQLLTAGLIAPCFALDMCASQEERKGRQR